MPSPAFALKNALELPQCHYIDWGCSGSGEIIPLREPSPADAARVKAWRKHARENTLPPVLLWWVTGLEAYVILDGHDRRPAQLLACVYGLALKHGTIGRGGERY